MNKRDEESHILSRRQFIGSSLTLATGLVLGAKSSFGAPAILKKIKEPDSKINGVQMGVITYSYRSMPNQDAESLLKDIVNSRINAIELMGGPAERFAGKPKNPVNRRSFWGLTRKAQHGQLTEDEKKHFANMRSRMKAHDKKVAAWRESVSMDKYVQLKEMYEDAGVSIYAWKPDALGKNNTDAEINYALKVARVLGAGACTVEHPGDDDQTERLGKFAAQHEIYMAYHAHTQVTPTLWDTALRQSDYNAINFDIGHWVAAGNPSPIPFMRKYHDRIESMHVKDRTTPDHGSGNVAWGQGDTPIVKALELMRDEHYTFPASVELEYPIPNGSDAVKEVSKCLAYSRKVLEG